MVVNSKGALFLFCICLCSKPAKYVIKISFFYNGYIYNEKASGGEGSTDEERKLLIHFQLVLRLTQVL